MKVLEVEQMLSPSEPEGTAASMRCICSTINWQATLANFDLQAARKTLISKRNKRNTIEQSHLNQAMYLLSRCCVKVESFRVLRFQNIRCISSFLPPVYRCRSDAGPNILGNLGAQVQLLGEWRMMRYGGQIRGGLGLYAEEGDWNQVFFPELEKRAQPFRISE